MPDYTDPKYAEDLLSAALSTWDQNDDDEPEAVTSRVPAPPKPSGNRAAKNLPLTGASDPELDQTPIQIRDSSFAIQFFSIPHTPSRHTRRIRRLTGLLAGRVTEAPLNLYR